MLSLALFIVSVSGQWSLSIRFLFAESFLDVRVPDVPWICLGYVLLHTCIYWVT